MKISRIFLTLAFIFLFAIIFAFGSYNRNLTGMVIYSDDNYTKQNALIEINNSESMINDLKSRNLSAVYVTDLLLDAKKKMEIMNYAEILRNSSSAEEKRQAEAALSLVSWENMSYADVILATSKIKETRDIALGISDSLYALDKKINESKINDAQILELFNSAKTSFYEERYSESESFIKSARDSIEAYESQNLTMAIVKDSTSTFLSKYWMQISATILILFIIFYFSHNKLKEIFIKERIAKLKYEELAITELIKKLQDERFNENKISELVYNIRLSKYKDRLNTIRETTLALKKQINHHHIPSNH